MASSTKIRRFTITTPAIGGVRDFEDNPDGEADFSKSDDESRGYPVKMSDGDVGCSFKMLAHASGIASGYLASLVVAVQEIAVAAGVETATTKTYTYTDCFVKMGASAPTDGRGEISVSVEARVKAIT